MMAATILARAIETPSSRQFSVLSRHGHLDQNADAYGLWRTPFRIESATIEGTPGEKSRALVVLRNLATQLFARHGFRSPTGTWWAAALSQELSVWRIRLDVTYATPSANPTQSPLTTIHSLASYVAVAANSQRGFTSTGSFQGLTDGLHSIANPVRSLLRR